MSINLVYENDAGISTPPGTLDDLIPDVPSVESSNGFPIPRVDKCLVFVLL